MTSASGSFTGLEGYQFSTRFLNDTQFETENTSGSIESSGIYSFKGNKLILQANAGIHANESLEIILQFTNNHEGVYKAHYLHGAQGEQTGIFTLR